MKVNRRHYAKKRNAMNCPCGHELADAMNYTTVHELPSAWIIQWESYGYAKQKTASNEAILEGAPEGERGKIVDNCFSEAKSTKQGEWGFEDRKPPLDYAT